MHCNRGDRSRVSRICGVLNSLHYECAQEVAFVSIQEGFSQGLMVLLINCATSDRFSVSACQSLPTYSPLWTNSNAVSYSEHTNEMIRCWHLHRLLRRIKANHSKRPFATTIDNCLYRISAALHGHVPSFEVSPNQVQLLHTPADFHSWLIVCILTSLKHFCFLLQL